MRPCKDDCGREAEFRSQYCAECSAVHRNIKQDAYRHNWKANNPEKVKRSIAANNKRLSESGYFKTYKVFTRCLKRLEAI